MTCPICEQKTINCDCTETERKQHAEIEELRLTAEEREAIEYFAAFSRSRHAPLHTGEDDMTDLPGRLRVMARLTGRDDDADTAAEAAREIERLRLTDAERQAVETAIIGGCEMAATLRKLLDRLA